jgi:hypothetical protein
MVEVGRLLMLRDFALDVNGEFFVAVDVWFNGLQGPVLADTNPV